ncbi:MAG: T9SS type A sorting domain-containing protein [Pedobacter sp.]|nr:MAG: T9SS type A sorting domain-containing protein [Pedobacter sp.]
MKKNYFSMRKPYPQLNRWLKWLTVCLLFFAGQLMSGQNMGTIQVGSGSGTTASGSLTIPVTNYVYSYTQHLVTAAEYAGGGGVQGSITKMRFKATSLGTVGVWNNWTVFIGNTNKTAFSSTTDWISNAELTQVFSGTITPIANSWFEITFTQPFSYTGGNIVVAVDENTLGWTSVPTFSTYASTENSGIIYRSDSTDPNPVTPPTATGRTATLPQIQFEGSLASCLAPSGIAVVPMPYTAGISWTATTNAENYNWIVVADNAGPNATPVASGSGTAISLTATGLSHTTAYDLYVKTDCGDDGISSWSPKVDFTTPVACVAPTLGISSNVNLSSATLGWTSTGTTFEVNWGTGTFNAGEGSNTVSAVSSTTLALDNLNPNTTYRWFVRQDCSASSDGNSTWAGPYTFFTGYCVPSSTSAATFINNLSTAGAMANISNLASGYANGGYQNNFDTAGITHFAGGSFSLTATITGGTAGLNVWVDWNNNFLFEDNERIYISGAYVNGVTNYNVTLPNTVAIGTYRMRVTTDYNITNPFPCTNVNTRTETEDYKFTIVAQPQDAISWANLQAFVVGGNAVTAMQPCQTVDVYTQAWDATATEPAGANPDLRVWIGRYSENTDPATWPESAFTLATYNTQVNNNDEYKVTYTTLPAGNQYFVARYKLGFGPYRYGASNNGFWNGENNPAALLTVGMPAINVTASETSFCVNAAPVTINISSENPNYTYTLNGVATTGTELVTPVATTTYAVVGTDSVTGCTSTASITITISENLSPATISYSDTAMCVGSVQELSVDGGTNALLATSGTGALTSQSGSNTLTGPNPFQNYYGGTKEQLIFKAAELTALGFVPNSKIKSIAVNIVNPSGGAALNAVVVKMKNATKSAFASTTDWETGMVTVRNAATLNPVAGQNTLLLDTPFTWDGGNLVVEINYSNNNAGGSGANTAKYSTTNFASTLYLRVDNATATAVDTFDGVVTIGTVRTFNVFNSRTDIQFNVDVPGDVTWSPVADLYIDAAATVPYVANTFASEVYTKPASTISYVATVANAYGCTVATASQEFTLLPVVAMPTIPSEFEVCPTATVADLLSEVTGTAVQLYDALAGGVALAPTASLIEGSYYASQTVGGCESARAELVVLFSIPQAPNFPVIGTLCEGSVAPLLATTSPNGIEGTWAPAAIDNMASGTYVFTPNAGICAVPQTLEVTVSSTPVAPDFATALSFCSTDLVPVLTTISPNGIVGTWNPAVIDSDVSGTYIFTPVAGQCGSVHQLVVTITTAVTPNFEDVSICLGNSVPVLQLTSPNGVSGSWSPATIDATQGGDYLFTPDAGECANAQTITVTINPVVAPNFVAIGPLCVGGTVPTLASTSPNGVTGTWIPATIDASASGMATYTFLPDAGQCSVALSIIVTVNDLPSLVINNPAAVCSSGTVDITADAVTAGSGTGLTFTQWADPFGMVSFPNPNAITSSGTFYIKAENANGCSVILPVTVVVKDAVDAPTTASATQDFNTGDDLTDFEVTGTNLIWYDAASDGNVIPSSTVVTTGTVYYVSQTVGGCESEGRLMITAGVDLKTPGFESASLRYYPNPVTDVLTVTYSSAIENVEIFNVLGQKVYQKAHNSQEVKIDMSSLATGNYIVNVMANGLVKNIKVIKK